MKNSKIYLSLLAVGALTCACNDLDQMPNGSVATVSQKEDALKYNPDLASAGVNALPESVNAYMTEYGTHQDYGWGSMMLVLDARGMDMPSVLNNYQWSTAAYTYQDWGGRYYNNLYYWAYNYDTIHSANLVLGSITAESTEPELLYYRAQALTFRAFSYFNLAQMYAFTYAKDPNAACVPIILDTNMDDVATNGCARSTVAEVYNQVNADLTEAIADFITAEKAGITRDTMSEAAVAKTFANTAVAYGLRARADLFRCDYTSAVADAQAAIEAAAADGMEPYTRTEVAVPAFTTLNARSYIWGMYADSSLNRYKGVANWASMVTGWQTNGYTGGDTYRCINKALYATIPSSDVRKGWWLDGNGNAPSSLPAAYANYVKSGYKDDGNVEFPPYAQLKFGAPGDAPVASGAVDQPLLRVEELYYILAEAQGATSVATGAQTLNTFVKTYRDTGYNFTAASFEALRDEIWRQRRIEFWGEGLAYWDLMRLQKGVDRRGGGFDPTVVFNIEPTNTVLLFDIPQPEVQRNPLVGEGTNGSSVPEPVDDID